MYFARIKLELVSSIPAVKDKRIHTFLKVAICMNIEIGNDTDFSHPYPAYAARMVDLKKIYTRFFDQTTYRLYS
jgi:hypothetical protein